MALGGRTDLCLVESVPATARALRKAGGHSRGILVLGGCSDLLAFPASRLGGGVKVSFARNAFAPSNRLRMRRTFFVDMEWRCHSACENVARDRCRDCRAVKAWAL